MAGNYWEETVYSVPPLEGLDRTDTAVVFSWLDGHFPVNGTKIDWHRAEGNHVHWRFDDDAQLAAAASREICQRFHPGLAVEHVGDGLSPYGIRFTGENSSSIVAALLEIPEHHYFVAEDRSWIVAVTTEGDLDVVDRPHLEEAP